MIRGLVFDLDGTLIDSAGDIIQSTNHVRVTFNLDPLPEENIRSFIGRGLLYTLGSALEGLDPKHLHDAVEIYRDHYQEHCLDSTIPYSGVIETLEDLADLPMMVLSNKPGEFCRQMVEGLDMTHHFMKIFGADDVPEAKPGVAAFHAACEVLDLPPEACLMVGDAETDITGGRDAGMVTCGVLYGIGKADMIRETDADHFISTFTEVRTILGRP